MTSVENQFVNFKIITRNSRGNVYRWWMLWVFVFFLTFLIISDGKIPGAVMGTMACVMLALLFFFGIKVQLLQEHDEIGWVMLTSNQIIVKFADDEIEYSIDKSTTLSLEIRGYAGEPIIGQWVGDKKGYDNFISLTNAKGTGRYEILVSNKMKIDILDRLIVHYRRQGAIIKYVDQSSDDSKKSLILRFLLAFRHAR